VSLVIAWRWRDLAGGLSQCCGPLARTHRRRPAAQTGYTRRRIGWNLDRAISNRALKIHLSRRQPGARFHGSSLNAILRDQGVTQIRWLAGVATSIGVESTARSAYEHGYHVVLAIDAMPTSTPARIKKQASNASSRN